MKDPYVLLSQKEQELDRVRREIGALLTVIPLLEEYVPSWDELKTSLLTRIGTNDQYPPDNCIKDLETYYPFVTKLSDSVGPIGFGLSKDSEPSSTGGTS